MGKIKYSWQDRDYVLSWFGRREKEAKGAYHQYVQEGISHGRRPELVGGGLIRSVGGWSQVLSLRRHNERVLTDERILGSGDFVARMVKEADAKLKYVLDADKRRQKVEELIEEVCKIDKINPVVES